MRKAKAFTLVELLVAIAIILVLVGILTPVLARAKRAAQQTVGVSNLHQLSQALIIYSDDHGGPEWMPPFETAQRLVAKLPKCDPLDDWSPACKDRDERPLLGSYGYAPAVIEGAPETYAECGLHSWADAYLRHPGYPLLASAFFEEKHSCKFFDGGLGEADAPAWLHQCAAMEGWSSQFMPSPVLRVGVDGGVVRVRHSPNLWAMWPYAFSVSDER